MISYLAFQKVSPYNVSFLKRIIDIFLSLLFIFFCLPLIFVISFTLITFSGFPIFFFQKRVGAKGVIFKMIKFRTMEIGSEKQRRKYMFLNEADGPVFKIKDDPRLTKIGKIIMKFGLDELPQLFNVLKGDMSLVGPRPLPVYEYRKLSKKDKLRNLIRPGITSTWVVEGGHTMRFNSWMILDSIYVESATFLIDFSILFRTCLLFLKVIKDFLIEIIHKDM